MLEDELSLCRIVSTFFAIMWALTMYFLARRIREVKELKKEILIKTDLDFPED